jgi:hypothetical protein
MAGNQQLIAEGMMKSSLRLAAGFVCVILITLCQGGSLTPPTAPMAGTMKPLSEVEPRTAIPGSTTATSTYTISQSGSYYLTGNRQCSGTGITVNADNVTIDLSGFTIAGPGSGTNYGVYMNGRGNVEIRKGTIQGFGYGIYESSTAGKNHRVLGVRVISNTRWGINLNGENGQVRDCTVSDNGTSASGAYGIIVNVGGIVTGNTVNSNGTSATSSVYSIFTGGGCTVTGNTVYSNGTSAVGSVYGIYTTGSTVAGNSVYGNGNLATGSFVFGIYVGFGSSVIGNTVRNNGVSASGTVCGIYLSGYDLATNNTAYGNSGTGGGTNLSAGTGCLSTNNLAP